MTALHWLVAANAALWIGLGLYAAFLARKQRELALRVAALEVDHE